MVGNVKLINSKYHQKEDVPLHDTFFNPEAIYMRHFNDILRGLITQEAAEVSTSMSDSIQNRLFQPHEDGLYGLDLAALTIQRGRDHGVPSYKKWLKHCHDLDVMSWADLHDSKLIRDVEALKKLYELPEDVDLIIGGLMEERDEDSTVGPTLKCIIKDQFTKIKIGDRFWYENEFPQKIFNKGNLWNNSLN